MAKINSNLQLSSFNWYSCYIQLHSYFEYCLSHAYRVEPSRFWQIGIHCLHFCGFFDHSSLICRLLSCKDVCQSDACAVQTYVAEDSLQKQNRTCACIESDLVSEVSRTLWCPKAEREKSHYQVRVNRPIALGATWKYPAVAQRAPTIWRRRGDFWLSKSVRPSLGKNL